MDTKITVKNLTAEQVITGVKLPAGQAAVVYLSKDSQNKITRKVTVQPTDFQALANARTMAYKMRDSGLKDFVGVVWGDGHMTYISTDVPASVGGASEI